MKSKTAIGAIQNVTLPEGFSLCEDTVGKVARSHLRRYESTKYKSVEIAFFYRGNELSSTDTNTLRQYLSQPNQVLIEIEETEKPTPKDVEIMQEFYYIIGTPGNNQISNSEKGIRGPRFHLASLETLMVSGKRCLAVNGWYHGPKEEVHNYFYGVYFDSKRSQKLCKLEEVYLHAPTSALFDYYLPDFQETLKTIVWK
ncbi:MAG: hypothetical protein SFY67_19065 [Candidatus Melainabacteria bacterium]|nr:hypothetical protein [Candidatus Melainabacteria bacterium]